MCSTPLTPLEPWTQTKIGRPALSADYLAAYQLQKLNETLSRVRQKSLFYRNHLASVPEELTRLEEIGQIPFTTSEDLGRAPLQFLCVSQSQIQRVVTLQTSGTTGEPKRIYFTQADHELTIDFFQHGMTTFTQPGDRVLICLPGERPGSVGELLARGLNRMGAVPIPHGPIQGPQQTLKIIQAGQADGLVGSPVHVLALARFWTQNPTSWTPRQVLLSTDHVPRAVVAAIEAAWNCTVYNHYGMTEMGLGGGVDCQARRGYHLREADLLFEIIDPMTARPVPTGQTGEVVFTTLTRVGMPLIRYRTGDLSRLLPGKCGCGTRLKSMEHVRNRLKGGFHLGGTEDLTMADLDEALFPLDQLVNFSALLTGDQRRACLHLEAVLLPGSGTHWKVQVEAALESIPAVGAALRGGRLEVQVSGRDYDSTIGSSLAKRKVIDQRRESNA